jgi:carboxyl-terminal processing protease
LTVKKPDGLIQEIPIIREVVVIEESYARSLVFEFKGHKLGLIQLPSFYADFSARGRGRNCTGDVQAEIEKLQRAGAEGIVLDLRNNGGGSLADAIEMSGLFIPSGPIVQVRFPNGGVQQAADPDPSVRYDDPLVILTNTYSASASEILAAALQDYGRAIIVGSKSTFGKGTVQTFVPLEGPGNAVFPDGFGQVKVTIQKFYRINGGTTQLVGVVPDVILPDLYDEVERGEKEMEFHLEYDKIRPAAYRSYSGSHGAGKGTAIDQANARIAAGEYYKLIRERSKQLGVQRAQYEYPLDLNAYSALQQDWQIQAKKVSDYPYQTVVDSLYALPVDIASAQGDEAKMALKTDWIKRYKKDVGIDEAAQILSDWLSQ